jgi:hypothetical protein
MHSSHNDIKHIEPTSEQTAVICAKNCVLEDFCFYVCDTFATAHICHAVISH